MYIGTDGIARCVYIRPMCVCICITRELSCNPSRNGDLWWSLQIGTVPDNSHAVLYFCRIIHITTLQILFSYQYVATEIKNDLDTFETLTAKK